MNFYDILMISADASAAEIEDRYQHLLGEPGVDRSLLEEAYLCLTDPFTRRQHDEALGLEVGERDFSLPSEDLTAAAPDFLQDERYLAERAEIIHRYSDLVENANSTFRSQVLAAEFHHSERQRKWEDEYSEAVKFADASYEKALRAIAAEGLSSQDKERARAQAYGTRQSEKTEAYQIRQRKLTAIYQERQQKVTEAYRVQQRSLQEAYVRKTRELTELYQRFL